MSLLTAILAGIVLMGEYSVSAQQKLPITWPVTPASTSVAPGASVRVEITARIDEGWHLYSVSAHTALD
jgi:hypothetical protein